MKYTKPQCNIKRVEGNCLLASSTTIGQVGDNKPLGAKGNTPIFDNSSDDWPNDSPWSPGGSK